MDIHHHPPIYLWCMYIYIYINHSCSKDLQIRRVFGCVWLMNWCPAVVGSLDWFLRSPVDVVCWNPMVDQIRATMGGGWYPLQITSTGHRMNQLCVATGLQVRSRYVEASWNRGIPKSFMFICLFLCKPSSFWGTTIYGNPHLILCNHHKWLCITAIHH